MTGLLATAGGLQQFLSQASFRFCFIGGIALQRWGEPRFTRNVDLTLLCPFGEESGTIDRLLHAYAPRIEDARAFALRNRVLLLVDATGVPIDIALGAIPFEERCIVRASGFDFGPVALLTCSAEDLIVLKAFAGRPQDWVDVEAVAVRQGARLDWELVLRELEPLDALREAPEASSRVRQIRTASGAPR
ncbi:MAG: DUF6036 family nucleotidyltransferase [Proteobacteria bacterium]|nr:DUF6036 family nucleotidyltransferase [Pseudomonadota bacterium]